MGSWHKTYSDTKFSGQKRFIPVEKASRVGVGGAAKADCKAGEAAAASTTN